MVNPLVEKLSSFIDLSNADRAAIETLCLAPIEGKAGTELIREGDRPEVVYLLLKGWAYRYKILADGSRQIIAVLLPGDLCDQRIFILGEIDHSIGLLSDARYVKIPKEAIIDLTERHPAVARGFWWATLVDEAILREWLVGIGQRSSFDRLGHLFCELWLRMRQVGLTDEGRFHLPLTQEQLGDALGMTSVHVNRMLQKMRTEGLIVSESKQLIILDPDRLRSITGFNPNYLHLIRRKELAPARG